MFGITNFITRNCCTAPPSLVGQNSEIVVSHQTPRIPLLPSNTPNSNVGAIAPPRAINMDSTDTRDEFDNEICAIKTALDKKTPCMSRILDLQVSVNASSLDRAEKSSYTKDIDNLVKQYLQNQSDAGIQEADIHLVTYRTIRRKM